MGKKLSGSINAHEEIELDGFFQQYPDVWYAYEVLISQYPIKQIPDDFIKEIENILNTGNQQHKIERVKPVRKLWAKVSIAALVVIVFSWSLIWSYSFLNKNTEAKSRFNEIAVIKGTKTDLTLPDGTHVVLNSGSRLTYPKNYAQSAVREIWLTGEAYFKVEHDASHPFIIHTKNLDIRDIGTTFNVKAYPDELTEASLIEGAIEVSFKNNNTPKILLKPRQKIVVLNKHTDNTTIKQVENNYKLMPVETADRDKDLIAETAWVTDQLVFKNEPFEDVAKKMERRYNVEFVFNDDEAKDYPLTGIFKDETVEQALKVLQEISPFDYRIEHDKIFITSKTSK